jgi:D-sedoheptulose 7-phosphate isomerase
MDLKDLITEEINHHQEAVAEMQKRCSHDIARLAELMVNAYRNGNKILIFGNGGSAADAQHIVADLVGRLTKDRRAFAAIALTTNTSNLTAIANDYGYDSVFERQVEALANQGDVLIGISTSGKSRNVLKALDKGKELGCITGALTGKHLCPLDNNQNDVVIHAPSTLVTRIQEMHILIGHILCLAVENELA